MSELEAIPICPGHGHKKDIFHANPAVCPESPHQQDRQVIPEAAVEAESVFVVYGGNGLRRLRSFATRPDAEEYAANFERQCWAQGVAVPRSRVMEEAK